MQYKVSNSHNQGQTDSQISTYNFPVDINNSQYLPTDLCTSVQCHKTDEVLALKIKLLLQYRPAKISASRDENILFNRRARLLQRTVLMGAPDVDCCCCFLFCVWVHCSFPLCLNISVFHLASLIISSLVGLTRVETGWDIHRHFVHSAVLFLWELYLGSVLLHLKVTIIIVSSTVKSMSSK